MPAWIIRATNCLLPTACCLLSTGCASLFSGRTADVRITSMPSNATVLVHNQSGEHVTTVQTPATVTLKRKHKFFRAERYTATIAAEGYQPTTVAINQKLNPWMIGNAVFGFAGVVGLGVDGYTGAAWKPEEAEIHRELAPLGGPPMQTQQPVMTAGYEGGQGAVSK
jgi:hypothetical protein